jgi:hypothetical protein
MACQIFDSQIGNYDNPSIQALVDKIFPEIKFLLKKTNTRYGWILTQLAEETMKYIKYIVSLELSKEPEPLDYLNCLKEACDDVPLDIFTVNHDTVLERFLNENGIKFKSTDGFFKPNEEEHKYWKPSLFNDKSFKIRLFKLHGSINWFCFWHENSEDQRSELIVIPFPPHMNNYKIKNAKGHSLYARDKRPLVLIGTYNKMLEYTSGIFEELNYQFYRSLNQAKELVICGYGFGDRGINNKIEEWMDCSNKRRITLINPYPETLENKLHTISKWKGANRLKVLQTRIENVCWRDLKGFLSQNI